MVDHLSEDQIDGYRERTSSPARLLAADRHLAACAACRERLKGESPSRSALDQVRDSLRSTAVRSDHLTYEAMEDYIKNRAGVLDREALESHVEVCSACDKELQDLQEFAAMMVEAPGNDLLPLKKESAWRRFLLALDKSSKLRLIGGLTAILLVVSVTSVLILNVSISERSKLTVTEKEAAPASPAVGAIQAERNSQTSQRDAAVEAGRAPTLESEPRSTLALDLTTASENSSVPSLTLAPHTGILELRALVRQGTGAVVRTDASYGARLSSGRDSTIDLAGQKPSPSGIVTYQIPASQLRPGDYNLAVFPVPRKSDVPAAQYRFTIRR